MNKYRWIYTGAFLLLFTVPAQAQAISPWFRSLTQVVPFQTLTGRALTYEHISRIPLAVPLRGNPGVENPVKTTVGNWLQHRLFYSGTLSRMEKEILAKHPDNPLAVPGKLIFFHDRDALLATALQPKESMAIDLPAFQQHQDLLAQTRAEIEYARGYEMAYPLSKKTGLLSRNEVFGLISTHIQPPIFVLTQEEIARFSLLPTLERQRNFARQKQNETVAAIHGFLSTPPYELSTQDFADYYWLKLRHHYFSMLSAVLARANQPRKSIIVRMRQKLGLDFLPQADESLTDAQRFGKLLWFQGKYSAQEEAFDNALDAQKYNLSYAQAEALGVAYEQLLGDKVPHAEMVLGYTEAMRLGRMSDPEILRTVPARRQHLQQKMNKLTQKADPTPEDYAEFFRLYTQDEFLQSCYHKAHIFEQFNRK